MYFFQFSKFISYIYHKLVSYWNIYATIFPVYCVLKIALLPNVVWHSSWKEKIQKWKIVLFSAVMSSIDVDLDVLRDEARPDFCVFFMMMTTLMIACAEWDCGCHFSFLFFFSGDVAVSLRLRKIVVNCSINGRVRDGGNVAMIRAIKC